MNPTKWFKGGTVDKQFHDTYIIRGLVLPSCNNNSININKLQNYSHIQKNNFHYKNIVSTIISKMNFFANNNNHNKNQSGNSKSYSNLSEADELPRKGKNVKKTVDDM